MTVRVIFFNGFVGQTAKDLQCIQRERIEAAVWRFRRRELYPEEGAIQKVIIVGEANQPNYADVRLMKHLGAAGVPVDQMVLAGNATDTLHAIRLFVIKVAELYPDQHIRVHVATHRWLMPRMIYYMQHWHRPDAKPLPLKVRGCTPRAGYQPNWWERFREWSRRGDTQQAIFYQDYPAVCDYDYQQRQTSFGA